MLSLLKNLIIYNCHKRGTVHRRNNKTLNSNNLHTFNLNNSKGTLEAGFLIFDSAVFIKSVEYHPFLKVKQILRA